MLTPGSAQACERTSGTVAQSLPWVEIAKSRVWYGRMRHEHGKGECVAGAELYSEFSF